MTITEQFKTKRCVFSIECFPPKQTTQMDKLKDTLQKMQALTPGFISVTFGAGGSAGGVSTAEVADYIQNELRRMMDLSAVTIENYVVENGKLTKLSPELIYLSKHLGELSRRMNENV